MLGYFIFDLFCLVRSFSVSCVIWLYPERDGESEEGRGEECDANLAFCFLF